MSEKEKSPNWGTGRAKGSYDQKAYEAVNWSTIRLSPADLEMLKTIGKFLNCNKSDAVRTAIRVYAAIVSQMQQQ